MFRKIDEGRENEREHCKIWPILDAKLKIFIKHNLIDIHTCQALLGDFGFLVNR